MSISAPQVTERDPITDFARWLDEFERDPGFCYIKSNHGFWDRLGDILSAMPWPTDDASRLAADRLVGREGHGFFVGGFVDDLVGLIKAIGQGDRLIFGVSQQAWRDSERIAGIPRRFDRGAAVIDRLIPAHVRRCDALLLKTAVETGDFERFMTVLADHHVIVVGPPTVARFLDFARVPSGRFIEIDPVYARVARNEVEDRLRAALEAAPREAGPVTVLLQAGTLAPYLALRLRRLFPDIRWVDCGLPLCLCNPQHLFTGPWAQARRREIVAAHNRWVGRRVLDERNLFPPVLAHFARLSGDVAALADRPRPERSPAQGFRAAPRPAVGLVEAKTPDRDAVESFLSLSARANHWSNFGPLDEVLAASLRDYGEFGDGMAVIPCASGTVALETLARIHDFERGRRLRWAAPGFGYFNVAQGRFADSLIIDCDDGGMLDLSVLASADPADWDGLVVTNPFGLASSFEAYAAYCRSVGKPLLIDNAAGFGNGASPDLPFQAFSFHQTKPFGVGEGGAMLVPRDLGPMARRLISHGRGAPPEATELATNGKMSEIAAAYILDRLQRAPEWAPLYRLQMARVRAIAEDCGLKPLFPNGGGRIAMSLPVLAPRPTPGPALDNQYLALAKCYAPLSPDCPNAQGLLERLVNIPCHPGVASLDRGIMGALLGGLAGNGA